AQGSDDHHRQIRQCFQRAGRGRHPGPDQVPRREMSYSSDLNFSVFQPTRVVFGDGAVGELALELKKLGVERAVIVTDKILREKTDVVARVEKALGPRHAGSYDG